jgi:hypothetical protein
MHSGRFLGALVVALIGAALCLPLMAAADDGDGKRREVRRAGTCTGSSKANLRVRAEDGEIRVRFEIDTRAAGSRWRVVLLHERRIAYRGVLRAKRSGGEVELRRVVDDWFGTDALVVRAIGPRGETCRASAVI